MLLVLEYTVYNNVFYLLVSSTSHRQHTVGLGFARLGSGDLESTIIVILLVYQFISPLIKRRYKSTIGVRTECEYF